jgi:F1F0 ATPase subunit 2
MNDYLNLLLALLTGMLLGVFFFAGLWWTVRRLASTKRVALWFVSSMLLRTSIVLLGFYFILGDNWQRLLAGLLGFFCARLMVTWFTRITQRSTALHARTGDES